MAVLVPVDGVLGEVDDQTERRDPDGDHDVDGEAVLTHPAGHRPLAERSHGATLSTSLCACRPTAGGWPSTGRLSPAVGVVPGLRLSLSRWTGSRSTDAPVPGRDFAYQPALDGVRGVAVALVMLFHAGFGWMSGGYVGVSVFFTLSGYLITSLALVEHGASGRLSVERVLCPPDPAPAAREPGVSRPA